MSGNSAQVPFLLKDLLQRPELRDLLGVNFVTVLRTFMGPPAGMNLRNVMWHGFSTEAEFPRCHFSFLLVLVDWIGARLTEANVAVRERPLVSLAGYDAQGSFSDSLSMLKEPATLAAIARLFQDSDFLVPTTEPDWVQFLADSQNRLTFTFIVGTLPMLEHGLRRIYARANSCPEKLVTANPDTFYTTLDEILAKTTESGELNLAIDLLGVPLVELLYDLFMVQTGPRLRDKVSHGEADPASLGSGLADAYLLLLVTLAFRFRGDSQLSVEEEGSLRQLSLLVDQYVSRYHPMALAKDAAVRCFGSLTDLAGILSSHGQIGQTGKAPESLLSAEAALKAKLGQELSFATPLLSDVEGALKASAGFQRTRLVTLFRSPRPLRLTGQVFKIVDNVAILISEVCSL